MAKAVTIKVKLVSSADTGFYYVAKKNSRTMTDKLVKKKYAFRAPFSSHAVRSPDVD
jgi:large subunit ribosomal protein L33